MNGEKMLGKFVAVASHSASSTRDHAALTLLLISLVLTLVGGFFAFDVLGVASSWEKQNSGVTAWGRRLREEWSIPNPFKMVGWIFFVFGAALLAILLVTQLILLFR
jgi:hypothetical protein